MLAGICDGKFAASRTFGNLKFETIDNRFALYGLKMTSSGLVRVDEKWSKFGERHMQPASSSSGSVWLSRAPCHGLRLLDDVLHIFQTFHACLMQISAFTPCYGLDLCTSPPCDSNAQ
jgi:hypothetical protein